MNECADRMTPRSILFVPGDRIELAAKAAVGNADAVCLDLEDGVATREKPAARQSLGQGVACIADAGKQVLVRINSEIEDYRFDLIALPRRVDGLVLAKASGAGHLELVIGLLADQGHGVLPCIAMVEDIAGLDAFAAMQKPPPGLAGLTIGSEDLAAEFQCPPDGPPTEFAFYRLLESARRLNVPLLGFPGSIAEFGDLERFESRVSLGERMGAAGAFCIHPRQVPVLNRVFMPAAKDIAWAHEVVNALDAAEREGRGAVAVQGRMVDRPVAERARMILRRAGP